MEPNEPTDEEVQALAEYIGAHSEFKGTLTVDRSNEEVPDGEGAETKAGREESSASS